MKTDIWMPIYIGDYFKNTNKLTAKKHGIYLLLIMTYWAEGELSDDLDELAMAARVAPGDSALTYILGKYFEHTDGRYIHSRVEKEMSDALASKEKAIKRAKTAADARWNNNNDATSITQALPEDMLEECPSPSPSSSPIQSKKDSAQINADFESFYKAYPKKKSKDDAKKAFKQRYKDMPPMENLLSIIQDWRYTDDWTKDGGKFVPYPATWLRAGGWEDEITKNTQSTQETHTNSPYDEYGKGGTHCKKCGKEADTLKWGECLPCRAGE